MASQYWEHRAALRQAAYDRKNNLAVATVNRAYDRTVNQLSQDIDKIFATYTRKTGLSADDAYKFLNGGIEPSFMAELRLRASTITDKKQREQVLTMLRTDAYRGRITRMQAIQDDAYVGMSQVADVELKTVTKLLTDQAGLAYSHMMYDVQKFTGYGFLGHGIPATALKQILAARWAGDAFSSRVWQNRDAISDLMAQAMTEQVSMGKLSDITRQAIRDGVDTKGWLDKVKGGMKSKFRDESQYAKYAANRLIRTESAYVCGQADAVVFEECEIERYEFIATLDSKACEKCGRLDGLTNPDTGEPYYMSKKEVGVNYGPIHSHCRCTQGAVIDTQDRANMKRRARKADGTTELVPASMNFNQWKAWQDDGAPNLDTWGETPVSTLAQKVKDVLKK